MVEESDPATELALTVAAEPVDAGLAWGLCDDESEPSRWSPRRVTTLALAGALVAIGAAGVVAFVQLRPAGESAAPVAAVESTVKAAVAPPVMTSEAPQTVIVTTVIVQQPPAVEEEPVAVAQPATTVAPPPTVGAVDIVAYYDRQFMAKMIGMGWTITDPVAFTQNAHQVCRMFSQGADPTYVNGQLVGIGMTYSDALMFSSTAMLTYPDCP